MNTSVKSTSKLNSLLDERYFQKKLRKVKQKKDYPLMVALADIIIDSFLLTQKKKSEPI